MPIRSSTPSGRSAIRFPATRNACELEGVIDEGELERLKDECAAIVEFEAQEVIAAPWPAARRLVTACSPAKPHGSASRSSIRRCGCTSTSSRACRRSMPARRSIVRDSTFLEAVMLGVGDALRADPSVFVFGEDVGGTYGNAFLLLRPLLEEFGDRILNSPLAEGAVLGACVGAALAGQRPIGEMQFNDFVATGFNQLVNNAAKIRYRWGGSVPMVVAHAVGRPASRRAVPQPEHRGVVLSHTWPEDRGALDAGGRARADGQRRCRSRSGALLRAHRALSRSADQAGRSRTTPRRRCRSAARRCAGKATTSSIISYGAYVHAAMRVAEKLAADRIEASVLDLRSLSPLDREAVLACARHCSRVLIVHEDSRTGGIGESLAAIIQEEAFESLDAPVRILAALDTPVPYSPPLEAAFLPSDDELERAARLLVAY